MNNIDYILLYFQMLKNLFRIKFNLYFDVYRTIFEWLQNFEEETLYLDIVIGKSLMYYWFDEDGILLITNLTSCQSSGNVCMKNVGLEILLIW